MIVSRACQHVPTDIGCPGGVDFKYCEECGNLLWSGSRFCHGGSDGGSGIGWVMKSSHIGRTFLLANGSGIVQYIANLKICLQLHVLQLHCYRVFEAMGPQKTQIPSVQMHNVPRKNGMKQRRTMNVRHGAEKDKSTRAISDTEEAETGNKQAKLQEGGTATARMDGGGQRAQRGTCLC